MTRPATLGACLALVLATPALAQPKKRPATPACLREAAAKRTPSLTLDGTAVTLSFATLEQQQRNGGGASVVYRLRLADEDSFAERKVSIGLLVKKGETLAGRTFEQHAGLDMAEQPDVVVFDVGGGTGYSPRVYFVDVASKPDDVRYEHGVASSVRVSFGKQTGGTLRGTIRLCIDAGQKDDTFQKTPTRKVVVDGTFDVDVSSLPAP